MSGDLHLRPRGAAGWTEDGDSRVRHGKYDIQIAGQSIHHDSYRASARIGRDSGHNLRITPTHDSRSLAIEGYGTEPLGSLEAGSIDRDLRSDNSTCRKNAIDLGQGNGEINVCIAATPIGRDLHRAGSSSAWHRGRNGGV